MINLAKPLAVGARTNQPLCARAGQVCRRQEPIKLTWGRRAQRTIVCGRARLFVRSVSGVGRRQAAAARACCAELIHLGSKWRQERVCCAGAPGGGAAAAANDFQAKHQMGGGSHARARHQNELSPGAGPIGQQHRARDAHARTTPPTTEQRRARASRRRDTPRGQIRFGAGAAWLRARLLGLARRSGAGVGAPPPRGHGAPPTGTRARSAPRARRHAE